MPLPFQQFGLSQEPAVLTPEASDYLTSLDTGPSQEDLRQNRLVIMTELLAHVLKWLTDSETWRQSSFENDWLKWQRAADSQYDPVLTAKKKAWQSRAHVDITASHRESIHAAIYRMVIGSRPILEIPARSGGDPEQGENVRDLILRENERSHFELAYDQILEDATTYGSGFARIIWHENYEDRKVRLPIFEQLNPLDYGSLSRRMSGQPQVLGYRDAIEPRLIYRGIKIDHIAIRDFFPDPKALAIKGRSCAYRFEASYQDILDGVALGYYFREAAEILRDVDGDESYPIDISQSQATRNIADIAPRRTDYARRFKLFELYARLPKKWVLINGEEIDDHEKLVPARIIFHKRTICAIEFNRDYAGEAPFVKMDYMRVNGRFYGRGIPEMISNPQAVINEVVNQRLDEGALALQQRYAVVEKAVVNSAELEEGGPGIHIRINNKALGPNGDVRNVILPIDSPDVKRAAGFAEVYEWERIAQERTSANRVTLGTVGQVRDSNQTLGGQELLKQQAGEKFAYVAMVQEFSFLTEVFKTYWKLIYANIQPEDVIKALGQDRASRFVLMSPEEIESDYKLESQGIFEMESRSRNQAMLQSIFQQFAMAPWVNHMAFFDQIVKNAGLDPTSLKVQNAQAIEIETKAREIAGGILRQTAARPNEVPRQAVQGAPPPQEGVAGVAGGQ